MLRIIKETNIPFMKYRTLAYAFSGALILATIAWLIVNRGPNMSVDFAGGTLLEISANQVMPIDGVRAAIADAGLEAGEVQAIGDGRQVMLRFPTQGSADAYQRISGALERRFPGLQTELRREETVGPKIGSELSRKAVWAILGALGGILVFIGIRYEFKFALGAVLALFHDVFIVFGILCFFGREMSLTVVAALLTLAGYSINDTIVIFDRIRERMKSLSKESHERVFDIALNETLSRTLITAVSVLLISLSLLFFGGPVLNDFALTMVIGLIFGTYSSIYVASAFALEVWNWFDRRKKPARAKAA
jgi:preprotein translocase subunit SecF